MPGLEEMVINLSWVKFSEQDDLSCDAKDCSYEAIVRSFWDTPPECPHEIRNYCILHRDICLHDYEQICEGTEYDRWICSECLDATGERIEVWFLGMETIR